jgi:hypothetical protein
LKNHIYEFQKYYEKIKILTIMYLMRVNSANILDEELRIGERTLDEFEGRVSDKQGK